MARKDWWDEARSLGVSAVDFDVIFYKDVPFVKAKVVTGDLAFAYIVPAKDPTAREIGRAQVKALQKALDYIRGEFPEYVPQRNGNGRARADTGRTTTQQNNTGQRQAQAQRCEACGASVTPGVARYSKDRFGRILCRECQQSVA